MCYDRVICFSFIDPQHINNQWPFVPMLINCSFDLSVVSNVLQLRLTVWHAKCLTRMELDDEMWLMHTLRWWNFSVPFCRYQKTTLTDENRIPGRPRVGFTAEFYQVVVGFIYLAAKQALTNDAEAGSKEINEERASDDSRSILRGAVAQTNDDHWCCCCCCCAWRRMNGAS